MPGSIKMKGRIVSINISSRKHTVKKPVEKGVFIVDFGLEGDAHAGNGHRQVSLLAVESISKMEAKGKKAIASGSFAENITTRGIILHEITVGTRLRIGGTIHEVTQIGKECHNDCAIKIKFGECVMPKEGIFTRVVKGGPVKTGDQIEVIDF